jgi:hypothetical protein
MKKFAGVILFVCFCVGPAYVQAQTAPAAAPAKGPSVAQAVQQLEHDWVDAVKAGDTDKLGQLLADDWVGLGYGGGAKATKQSFLADVKSGGIKIQSFDFGPMNVMVIGSVAVEKTPAGNTCGWMCSRNATASGWRSARKPR